ATKSVSGGLTLHLADSALVAASHNIDPYFAHAYVETWYRQNPISMYMETLDPGELGTATHITQTDSFKASAFFNEFVRPQGCCDVIGVGLVRSPHAAGFLALQRSPDAIWVEPAEWRLLQALAPHLKRAASIHQLVARTRATADTLESAFEAAGFAIFLLSADSRVIFANAKAEGLVRRCAGLWYEQGRLAFASPALSARLHAIAREAARQGRKDVESGDTLEINRGHDHSPLLAHVFPVARTRAASLFDHDRPVVAVFVVDPDERFGAVLSRFAKQFGLTEAEKGLVAELLRGHGLLAAATRLNITEGTARTHAKRVFAKTGTRRQAELIRRYFETVFPGSPGGT
ncbi:MAG: helix-turn-helix transcriptional regulator, partial [Beijerinckiaceae bacterium]|nr:helix-turn-helix transcriptional regulator [Beijerinckiaceae bacterium]